MKYILVTGCGGFIGNELSKKLLQNYKNYIIIGIDNLNNYYDPDIKKRKILELKKFGKKFKFIKIDISNKKDLKKVFTAYRPDYVFNLAAQAGVRFSIENPDAYIKTNIVGFYNILDLSKKINVKCLFYASTSSVYGNSKKKILNENDNTDNPLSFYAATKKTNEVLAYSYFSMFNLSSIGFRFFTVYGPNGRPDMSIVKFLNSMKKNKSIDLYNKGNHSRDFTYIDDCINGIMSTFQRIIKSKKTIYEIFNISSNKKVSLKKVIYLLEKKLNKKFKKNYLPLQKGDIRDTFGGIKKLNKFSGYKSKVSFENGISNIIEWFNKSK